MNAILNRYNKQLNEASEFDVDNADILTEAFNNSMDEYGPGGTAAAIKYAIKAIENKAGSGGPDDLAKYLKEIL